MNGLSEIQLQSGVRLVYEDAGPAQAPCILMISGLGQQLVDWPDSLMTGLQSRGFRTLRFDNRDCGLSSRFDSASVNVRTEVMRQKASRAWRSSCAGTLAKTHQRAAPSASTADCKVRA